MRSVDETDAGHVERLGLPAERDTVGAVSLPSTSTTRSAGTLADLPIAGELEPRPTPAAPPAASQAATDLLIDALDQWVRCTTGPEQAARSRLRGAARAAAATAPTSTCPPGPTSVTSYPTGCCPGRRSLEPGRGGRDAHLPGVHRGVPARAQPPGAGRARLASAPCHGRVHAAAPVLGRGARRRRTRRAAEDISACQGLAGRQPDSALTPRPGFAPSGWSSWSGPRCSAAIPARCCSWRHRGPLGDWSRGDVRLDQRVMPRSVAAMSPDLTMFAFDFDPGVIDDHWVVVQEMPEGIRFGRTEPAPDSATRPGRRPTWTHRCGCCCRVRRP